MGIILGQIVFYLLHHLEEIVKADEIWVVFSFWPLGPNLHQKLLSFLRISLETLHNCFKVLDINTANLLLVKEIEYFFKVLDFLV